MATRGDFASIFESQFRIWKSAVGLTLIGSRTVKLLFVDLLKKQIRNSSRPAEETARNMNNWL